MSKTQLGLQQTEPALRDIFLYQKGEATNKVSVKRGLYFAKEELLRRLRGYEKDCQIEYFFDEIEGVKESFFELMELGETVQKYIYILNSAEQKSFSDIWDLIYEMDGHYHYFKYRRLAAKMGEVFEERLEELCWDIEEIYNSKFLKILDFNMEVEYQMSLKYFEEFINGFEYQFIKYHLAETMIKGGVVAVVAGSEGLTPKRIHGYELQDKSWKEYDEDQLESFREELLEPDPEATKRGQLRGYFDQG